MSGIIGSIGENIMNIIGLNFTHDASVSIFKDNHLIKHVELEKDNNERYAKAKSIDFFVKYLYYPVSKIDLIIISGSVKKIFNLDVDYYHIGENDSSPKKGFLNIDGVEIPYVCYGHVYSHMAGTNLMSGETDYSIVFDGGVVPIIYENRYFESKYIFKKEIFQLTGLVYSIMGYYFGKFKNADVISGKNCHSLHNLLWGQYNIPGNYMSYAALGEVDHRQVVRIKSKIRGYTKYNGYGFNEHDFLKFCTLLDFTNDASAIRTIHYVINNLMLDSIEDIIPSGSRIAVSGGCFLNIKLNAMIYRKYSIKTTVVMNDSGSSINAVCAHFKANNLYDRITYNRFCGLQMKNEVALDGLECVSSDISSFLNKNDEIVMSLFGKSEIGPRALGKRSLICKPFKGAKDRLNKIKKREDYRPVSPIVNEKFIADNFAIEIHDKDMVIENYAKGTGEYVHIDGSVRAMVSTDKIVGEIVDSVGGCLLNTSANDLGKGFFNDYKLAIEWASMNGVEYLFDGIKVYKIPTFDPYSRQVGGKHYNQKIPLSVFTRENNLDVAVTHSMKYLMRHKEKNGVEDLRKAIHSIELYMFDLYGEKK